MRTDPLDIISPVITIAFDAWLTLITQICIDPILRFQRLPVKVVNIIARVHDQPKIVNKPKARRDSLLL